MASAGPSPRGIWLTRTPPSQRPSRPTFSTLCRSRASSRRTGRCSRASGCGHTSDPPSSSFAPIASPLQSTPSRRRPRNKASGSSKPSPRICCLCSTRSTRRSASRALMCWQLRADGCCSPRARPRQSSSRTTCSVRRASRMPSHSPSRCRPSLRRSSPHARPARGRAFPPQRTTTPRDSSCAGPMTPARCRWDPPSCRRSFKSTAATWRSTFSSRPPCRSRQWHGT
mmetsp:Transcript_25715/g.84665  ORF Transcript_25715/g.84665 Transcript_25715/m.84665 type:complete len:227 (-) Transcript_25715:2010-2690(-)